MKITRIRSPVLGPALPACAALIISAGPAAAQQQGDKIAIEEIVVYSQQRAQDIMQVPIAVTAISGMQLDGSGIRDVFDLQQNVPSLVRGQSQTTAEFDD